MYAQAPNAYPIAHLCSVFLNIHTISAVASFNHNRDLCEFVELVFKA